MTILRLSENYQEQSLVFKCPVPGCKHRRQFDTQKGLRADIIDHFGLLHKTQVIFGGQVNKLTEITSLSAVREKFRRLDKKMLKSWEG